MPEALLARYGAVRVPRYTSYPTAAEFSDAVGPEAYGRWLGRLDPAEPVSLYLHVPFCRAICHYCGCHTKMVIRDEVIANYRRHLEAEIARVGACLPRRMTAARLHWGGGTPSIMEAEGLSAVIEALAGLFDLADGFEHAIELDPRTVTPDMARSLARLGINRASLGVQDLDPAVQAAIGRIQDIATVRDAVGALRGAGIVRLNMDLIYGLPDQTHESLAATCAAVAALGPDRIAAYGYAHLPEMRRNQRLVDATRLPGPRERLAQAATIARVLGEAGYEAIGLDHFARSHDALAMAARAGRLHRSFQGYTDDGHATVIGFGASAISRLPDGFAQNLADPGAYARRVGAGALATCRGIALTEDDRRRAAFIEDLMCNFRADLSVLGTPDDYADELALLRPLGIDGLVAQHGTEVRMTERGRPFVRVAASVFDLHRRRPAGTFSNAV